jgi:hypothetical protein
MKRRDFIKLGTLAGIGTAFFGGIIISCSGENISLEDIIEKNENILNGFQKEGNRDFAYYTINNFKNGPVKGEKVFIFCREGKITGYTIKIKGTGKVENFMKELDNTRSRKLVFSNVFGEEYQWTNQNRKTTLCYSKPYPGMPEYTFFSESLPGSRLIVF